MALQFEDLFLKSCSESTTEFLSECQSCSEHYQKLEEEAHHLFSQIMMSLNNAEILCRFEDLINEKHSLDQEWVYQKAFYDYSYLLKKMGMITSTDFSEEFLKTIK